MNLYLFTVPTEYHCDNHTPGEVFTVRLTGVEAEAPDWFYVERVYPFEPYDDVGDMFPVQMSELTPIEETP